MLRPPTRYNSIGRPKNVATKSKNATYVVLSQFELNILNSSRLQALLFLDLRCLSARRVAVFAVP